MFALKLDEEVEAQLESALFQCRERRCCKSFLVVQGWEDNPQRPPLNGLEEVALLLRQAGRPSLTGVLQQRSD